VDSSRGALSDVITPNIVFRMAAAFLPFNSVFLFLFFIFFFFISERNFPCSPYDWDTWLRVARNSKLLSCARDKEWDAGA
jgi:hypothetical protein